MISKEKSSLHIHNHFDKDNHIASLHNNNLPAGSGWHHTPMSKSKKLFNRKKIIFNKKVSDK